MKDGWQSTTDAATGRYVSPRRGRQLQHAVLSCAHRLIPNLLFFIKKHNPFPFIVFLVKYFAPAGLIGGTRSHVRRDGLNRRR